MNYKIEKSFIKNNSENIANIQDVLVLPHLEEFIDQEYLKELKKNQQEEWALWRRHGAYDISGESGDNHILRLLKNLIDVHPELVGLLKINDESGEMVDYVPEKLFKFDEKFIEDHIEYFIFLEDYIPFDLNKFKSSDPFDDIVTAQDDRELWMNEEILKVCKKMNKIVKEKCIYYEDRAKAYNSVLIEWIDCHPECEEIIAEESWTDYLAMKNNNEYIEFIDLLSNVELPFEKKPPISYEYHDEIIHRDDSNIMFPDFKKIDEIYEKYGASLLSCYLGMNVKNEKLKDY